MANVCGTLLEEGRNPFVDSSAADVDGKGRERMVLREFLI
jgi:hypothetical protein